MCPAAGNHSDLHDHGWVAAHGHLFRVGVGSQVLAGVPSPQWACPGAPAWPSETQREEKDPRASCTQGRWHPHGARALGWKPVPTRQGAQEPSSRVSPGLGPQSWPKHLERFLAWTQGEQQEKSLSLHPSRLCDLGPVSRPFCACFFILAG